MNLPNKITISRICLLPVFIFFYLADFIPYGKIIGAAIFVIAASTDFIDGKIARKRNLVTNLGKFLDPIADKLIVVGALLLVVIDGTIPAPYGFIVAIIIIGRELIISAFRQIAATKNVIMAADWWGKIKATVQDIAIPLLMVLAQSYQSNWFKGTFLNVYEITCYVLIGIATVLTIYSGINYVVKNKQVLSNKNEKA